LQYIYGFDRFADDIHFMVGIRPNWLIRIAWQFTSPLIVVAILVTNFIYYEEITYEGYAYPSWATTVGFAIMCVPIAMIPVYATYYFCYRMKTWVVGYHSADNVYYSPRHEAWSEVGFPITVDHTDEMNCNSHQSIELEPFA
jgi:hypothetical protein